MTTKPLAKRDLDEIVDTCGVWPELRGARLLITGGTGFFGKWLLEAIVHANHQANVGMEIVVLSRDPKAFAAELPWIANAKGISFMPGDVRSFSVGSERFSHVIHGATSASAKLNESAPVSMFDTIVEGTRTAVKNAVAANASRLLMVSSGAVYGRQPSEITHVSESFTGGPDPLNINNAYHEGKRAAEWLTVALTKDSSVAATIARCFAFVGPHLPLDTHFAIGNFIRDGLARRTIAIGGDGTPHRSYMYASDLVTWLLTILVRGVRNTAYNVGSEESVSIADLARAVGKHFHVDMTVAKTPTGAPPERYVPSTQRARMELGLSLRADLAEGISRTAQYHLAS